ncbi:50S ribosomal protein L24 [Mycena filopes]|nr:50S ribosomal protein L24 [Mycena filopes]
MRPTIAVLGVRAPSTVAVKSQPFKRAQFGLFGGKTKLYGNSVPFSLHKTRRTWLPNVQRKRLFSETLQSNIRVKVTTNVLRTVKKKGGVDKYLMETKADLLGWKGMQLRVSLRDAQKKIDESTKPQVKPAPAPKKLFISADPTAALTELQRPRTAAKFVRYTRRMAAKELGKTGFASAEETIKYMKEQKLKQNRLISRRASTKLPL